MGLVSVNRRSGMQVQAFSFEAIATISALYAVGQNRELFHDFANLRKSIELGFWLEAVCLLTEDDIAVLRQCVSNAKRRMSQVPIQVPFEEHRTLHLTLFRHLENPFVQGLLHAYWSAYQAYGLALYADISYHHELWKYHEQIVESVARKDYEAGREALAEHMSLLRHVPEQIDSPQSENGHAVKNAPIYHFFE